MKLASIQSKSRDGLLVVVSKDNRWYSPVPTIAHTLQAALDNWKEKEPLLVEIYQKLNLNQIKDKFPVEVSKFLSPLPRAYAWMDGSAFIEHILLVRKARGAQPPETLKTIPLMYQGGSDDFLAPTQDIPLIDFEMGLDFEGEVGVIVDDTPMGISPQAALNHIKLIMIINDITLRGLVPFELSQGFGFFQSKPSSAFAPFALTPDELGPAWKDGRVHLPLNSEINGNFFGNPNAGLMHFHFGELIAHAARTRNLSAGSIIGSGTVSNSDRSKGSSCLVERRMIEQLELGGVKTEYMKPGDTIKIEMKNSSGENLFGTIFQKVTKVN